MKNRFWVYNSIKLLYFRGLVKEGLKKKKLRSRGIYRLLGLHKGEGGNKFHKLT